MNAHETHPNTLNSPLATQRVLIFDFGSQYTHLIVRRCREAGVFSELVPFDKGLEILKKCSVQGVILSGGPASVYDTDAPHITSDFWPYVQKERIPVLGICYGMQEMQHSLGGKVQGSQNREYGNAQLNVVPFKLQNSDAEAQSLTKKIASVDPLLEDIPSSAAVWMSHGDRVTSLAPGFKVIATSDNSEFAAVSDPQRRLWGVQFHPEVAHTTFGKTILSNFIHKICGIPMNSWNMNLFADMEIERLQKTIGPHRHVIGALSGGVDSTVAAALLYKAIGNRFHGFMVDTGLLRKNEGPEVIQRLRSLFPGMQIELLDASEKFFQTLKGVTDPEAKRKRIGHLFVDTFVEATEKLKKSAVAGTFDNAFLLQGTLYPDVIESVSLKGPSHTIKTHHNVGGLPEKMALTLLEPLRDLFKDEVRHLGIELGLEKASVWRHPFPGPGLGIRIIGEVTPERVELLKEADAIFLEEIRNAEIYDKIGQAFAVLLPECRSVGVMGDQRTYGMTVVLRAIETSDFMTGDWYPIPTEVLKKCSSRIINEVSQVNRVCYDISSKPPATIEWE